MVFDIQIRRITLFILLILMGYATTVSAQKASLVSVDAVTIQPFKQTVPVIGRLVAKQNGSVATRISGSILDLLVQVGDRVTLGQPLAHIDTEQLQLRKRQAELQLTESRARLKTAKAQLALAGQEVKRLGSLKNSASVSRASYDDALQQQNIAIARVNEAEATIGSRKADIALTELELGYGTVVAPYNGTVTNKQTEIGSYVQAGSPIINLLSDEQLELEADVPYERLDGIPSGTVVSVMLDNNSEHTAEVRAIIPEENARTRTRRVRFNMNWKPNSGALAAGQSATVQLPAGQARQIISAHKDALIQRGNKTIVYVVVADKAELRTVQTGAASGDRIEILDGLQSGDLTVVRGNERLQPGQDVSVAQPQS